jgi:L-aminopeptidase/D-esterase-like protein
MGGVRHPGPEGSLADVAGLRVGHETLDREGWLTGVTVVVTPPGGATGGVDVRGGGPGTRETDLLSPLSQAGKVHAIVLSGGSAFGLSAAHGVMTGLAALHRGIQLGPDPSHVVPIVPAAILFDLGRGGVFGNYPGPEAGAAALEAALSPRPAAGSAGKDSAGKDSAGKDSAGKDSAGKGNADKGNADKGNADKGNAGAGTGALAGQLKGGLGAASEVLDGPVTVAALAAVNAVGSVADPRTGVLYGAQFGLPGEFDWLSPPAPDELRAGASRLDPRLRNEPPRPLNTTIGVVATDASLTKAQCAKLAGVAHDGLARAISPAHSMFDGDTIFGLATGTGPPASPLEFHAVLNAAADCFTRAIVHAILAARTVTTPDDQWPSYLDLFPSAARRRA